MWLFLTIEIKQKTVPNNVSRKITSFKPTTKITKNNKVLLVKLADLETIIICFELKYCQARENKNHKSMA